MTEHEQAEEALLEIAAERERQLANLLQRIHYEGAIIVGAQKLINGSRKRLSVIEAEYRKIEKGQS